MKKLRLGALMGIVAISALIFTSLIISSRVEGMAQGHDMSKMPGMNMSKPKPKTHRKTSSKKRRRTTKKRSAKKHQMGNMPGMNMAGMKKPATKASPSPGASPQQMNMPQAKPSPPSSPQKWK